MRSVFIKILAFALTVFLSACTERYDFKTNGGAPQLVITGYVCTEPGQYAINLSKTGNYFGTENHKDIPSGEVYINGERLTPNDTLQCQYLTRSDFCAKSGETYTLKVIIDFDGDGVKETYTAEAVAPNTVELKEFTLKTYSNKPEGSLFPLSTMLFFQDPGDTQYYYGAHLNFITKRDSLDSYKNYRISNTASKYMINMFDPDVTKGQYVFYPAYSIGKRDFLTPLDTLTVYPYDTIVMELNCHSYDYYQFLRNCQDAVSDANPFFTTPAGPISGNIKGGALGAFGVYTISRKRAVVPYKENTWSDEEMVKRFGYKWRDLFPKQTE